MMAGPMHFSMAHAESDEPNLNALAALAEGRLSIAERATALEHLESCVRCRRIAAELMRARSRTPNTLWTWRALPLAASLAIAAVGGGVYWLARDAGGTRRVDIPPSPSQPGIAPAQQSPAAGSGTGAGETGAATPRPERTPRVEPSDRTRAAGTRTIAGKTFRLVAGEWVDADYRVADAASIVDVRSREDFDAREQLRPFGALGRRFTVVVDRIVYRVDLPATGR